MKIILTLVLGYAAILTADAGTPVAGSPREITGAGDFNADGFADVLIVDKPTGLYRIGYGAADGSLTFAPGRPSGTAPVEAVAEGSSSGSMLSSSPKAVPTSAGSDNTESSARRRHRS